MANKLDYVILDLLESTARNIKAHPLNLGGVRGVGGGAGGPPGGFIGWLPQTRVAYDDDELATLATSVSGSLLDNLNHIRYRLETLEGAGSGVLTVDDWDGSPIIYNVNELTFSGAIVTDLGDGHALVVVSGGVGGAALTVEEADGSPVVNNVDRIIFSGMVVVDNGGGDVLVYPSGNYYDSRYLKLDASNDPITGKLTIDITAAGEDGFSVETSENAITAQIRQLTTTTDVTQPVILGIRDAGGAGNITGAFLDLREYDFSTGLITGDWINFTHEGTERFRVTNSGTVNIPTGETYNINNTPHNHNEASTSWKRTGIISPALTPGSTYNDWNPTGLADASVIYITSGAGSTITITGLTGGSDGRIITIIRGSSAVIRLKHQDSGSSAANQFYFPHASNFDFEYAFQAITLIYKSSAWRVTDAIAIPGTTTPLDVGTASVGVSQQFSRQDHVHGGGGTDSWVVNNNTWTYSSVDDPTGVVTINADVTTIMGLGDRIKLTNGGNTIYGIITKISVAAGTTTLTFLHEMTPGANTALYLLANSAITNTYYSHAKSPYGFPITRTKWTVSNSNTNDARQTTPSASTWYGDTNFDSSTQGPKISVPIGEWLGHWKALLDTFDTSVTNYNVYGTLSNASNSESDSDNTGIVTLTTPSGSYRVWQTPAVPVLISITAKTTYYINVMTTSSTSDNIDIRGDVKPSIIKLTCAYL